MRVGGAESEIAGERKTKPAPDRDAADDADGRAIELHQRPEAVLHRIAVVARRRGVAVSLVELGNVGAGAEMRALALDERDQHVLARLDRGADRRQRPPHRARDRIAALRAVEDDAGEGRLETQGYVGHEIILALRTPSRAAGSGSLGVGPGQARAGLAGANARTERP